MELSVLSDSPTSLWPTSFGLFASLAFKYHPSIELCPMPCPLAHVFQPCTLAPCFFFNPFPPCGPPLLDCLLAWTLNTSHETLANPCFPCLLANVFRPCMLAPCFFFTPFLGQDTKYSPIELCPGPVFLVFLRMFFGPAWLCIKSMRHGCTCSFYCAKELTNVLLIEENYVVFWFIIGFEHAPCRYRTCYGPLA